MALTREEMIVLLNEDIANEYGLVIQYLQHSTMMAGLYVQFSGILIQYAQDALEQTRKISAWIKYWEGTPTLTPTAAQGSSDPVTMLGYDLTVETSTATRMVTRIAQATEMEEFGLVDLLTEIDESKEHHKVALQAILA